MQFEGALLREQGVTFAIVIVKPFVLDNSSQITTARNSFQPHFPGVPVILMAQDSRGVPTFQGRKDIVQFLSRINPTGIPWKRYSIN